MKNKNNNEHGKRQTFGLFTIISMIVGIVVGSGIFYKSDDILINVGGSLAKAILTLAIGAIGIIFGSLTLSEFAIRTKSNGGFVSYYEKFTNNKLATGFAWFQTFLYLPSLGVVVSWAAAIYTFVLFDYNPAGNQWLIQTCLLGFAYLTCFIAGNSLSRKLGGHFQFITTVIKVLPLIIIAIAGLFFNNGASEIPPSVMSSYPTTGLDGMAANSKGFAWLAALPAVAFSYDGWVIATSIAPEVKNPKKNMRLGFIIAPIIIFIVYALYVSGVYRILGAKLIALTGNNAVGYVIAAIFSGGNIEANTPVIKVFNKILMFIIVLAILGVVNGIVIGGIRMPQALASKGMISDKSGKIGKINEEYQISFKSTLIFFVLSIGYMVVHYVTQLKNMFNGGDISEIAIVFSYLSYIILYVKVFIMKKKGEVTNAFTGYVAPILATLGSIILLIGSLVLQFKNVTIFLIICSLFFGSGMLYAYLKEQKQLVERLQIRTKTLEEKLGIIDSTEHMFDIENIDDDNFVLEDNSQDQNVVIEDKSHE